MSNPELEPEIIGWPEEGTPIMKITAPKEVFDTWQKGEVVQHRWRVSGSMMSGGTVIEKVSRKGIIASLGRALSRPKRVEPVFAPIEDQYPDFPGYIELRKGERLIVYSTGLEADSSSKDNPNAKELARGGQVFQHVKY